MAIRLRGHHATQPMNSTMFAGKWFSMTHLICRRYGRGWPRRADAPRCRRCAERRGLDVQSNLLDAKCVVSTANPKTDTLPPTLPGLAHCVRRYTARTATLCHTTATAARAGIRMDLFGSRGGGWDDTAGWRHLCVRRAFHVGGRPRRSDCPVMAVVADMCCLCSTRERSAWSLTRSSRCTPTS
jgi:hypothetical protein